MSIVKVQGNASGTGTLTIAAPNTNTDRTLTLPDNTGTLVSTGSTAGVSQAMLASGVAGNGPAFLAYPSSSQPSVSNSSWTAITFNNKDFDLTSAYSTSTGRFTPQVAGYYQFNLSLRFTQASSYTGVALYKNGGPFTGGYGTLLQASLSSNIGLVMSILTYMNGTTDYIVPYAYSNVGSQTISADSTTSQFSGFLARAA